MSWFVKLLDYRGAEYITWYFLIDYPKCCGSLLMCNKNTNTPDKTGNGSDGILDQWDLAKAHLPQEVPGLPPVMVDQVCGYQPGTKSLVIL